MEIREDILNELKTISTVIANVPYLNVYKVNAGYFSGIKDELTARIAADNLYGYKNDFTVPNGYFENLTATILQKIKAEENEIFIEINNQSPLIAGIGNKNIFTAPQNYFEKISYITEEKHVATVIKINHTRAILKYAAAAVITGLIGLSIINIENKTAVKLPSEVSVQTAAVINSANNILQTGTFDKELSTISDKDIEQFLQQGGQDVHAALVAASAEDADKLPEPADYLLDENALDKYLKKNNLKN